MSKQGRELQEGPGLGKEDTPERGLCQQDPSPGKWPQGRPLEASAPKGATAFSYKCHSVLTVAILIDNGKGQVHPVTSPAHWLPGPHTPVW